MDNLIIETIEKRAIERAARLEDIIIRNTPKWWQWLMSKRMCWLANRLLDVKVHNYAYEPLNSKVFINGKEVF